MLCLELKYKEKQRSSKLLNQQKHENEHQSSILYIYSPHLVSALDRTQCSDRSGIYIIDAVLKVSVSSSENLNLNKSILTSIQTKPGKTASSIKRKCNSY